VHRSLIASLVALALLSLALTSEVTGSRALAQAPTDPPDWELTGLTEPALRLFTPSSGVLFAQTATALMRSDDAGDTWGPVSLGPATRLLSSDPIQHTILYAAGPSGVYKTTDDAVTWALILAYGPGVGGDALALVVSPAEPNLLYLGVGGGRGAPADFRFFRSRDAGASWQQLEEQHFSLCSWDMPILQPHPTDARRVFRVADCIAGRNVGETLAQSTNAGESWTPLFNPQPFAPPFLGYPRFLVGGQGLEPRRFYVAVNRDRRVGGSAVVRSDDDGATWSEVLAYHGGGTPGFAPPGEDPSAPNVRLGGLAYEPAQPDHVYIGRQVFRGFFEPAAGGAVAVSLDGGETWADLGRQDIGAVSDLLVGADGRWLFAATDQGLWRWRLGAGGK
jgi:photosystem II stability/assembly factor-like uncharacterized protein